MPGAPPQAMVSADGICRTFGSGHTAVHALRGVSFAVGRGQLAALRGRSGSGKTGTTTRHAGVRDAGPAGRVQLPREMIRRLGMQKRVELQEEPGHIGVWPDQAGDQQRQ
jgi:putative ABC transport system ATP-binding protein